MTPSQWQCVITPLSTGYCFCSQSGAVRSSRAVNSNVQAPISSLTCEYNWLYLPLSSSLFALLRNALNSFWFCFWTLAFCLSFLFLGTENLCRKSTLYSPCSRPKLCFSTEGRLEHTCRNIMSNYCSLVVAGLLAKMNRDIQPGQGIMKRIILPIRPISSWLLFLLIRWAEAIKMQYNDPSRQECGLLCPQVTYISIRTSHRPIKETSSTGLLILIHPSFLFINCVLQGIEGSPAGRCIWGPEL